MSDQEAAPVSKTPFHDKLDPFIIDGTSSSHSYLAFARIGVAILAIKFGPPIDGNLFGVKACTYVGGRLRSQKITGKIKEHLEQEEGSNVAHFADMKKMEDWAQPWPGVKFEKSDSTRASTQSGAFIRGTLKLDPDALLDQFENGSVANKFADFLLKAAGGADHLLFSRDDLVGFIQEVYGPAAKSMRAAIHAEKEVMDQAGSSDKIGVFGFQQALMQELYEQKMTDHAPPPPPSDTLKSDDEESHDESEVGENEHDD